MTDFTEEIRRAYAQPDDELIIPTLEIRHPAVLDAEGSPGAIWVAHSFASLPELAHDPVFRARLETGQEVDFVNVAFNFQLPAQETDKPGSLKVEVARAEEICNALRQAADSEQYVSITYREYLADERRHPQYVLSGLHLTEAEILQTGITATAEFLDLNSRAFSQVIYDRSRFPGLPG